MPIRAAAADIQPFFRLLKMEEDARDLYKGFSEKVEDPDLRGLFLDIMHQEEGHVKLVRELIEIIQ